MTKNAKKKEENFKLAKNDGQKIIRVGSTMENNMASNKNLGWPAKIQTERTIKKA